jgi:hypothetical protein
MGLGFEVVVFGNGDEFLFAGDSWPFAEDRLDLEQLLGVDGKELAYYRCFGIVIFVVEFLSVFG